MQSRKLKFFDCVATRSTFPALRGIEHQGSRIKFRVENVNLHLTGTVYNECNEHHTNDFNTIKMQSENVEIDLC